MATSDISDLRSMSVDELLAKETEVRRELAGLSMKRYARRLDKTSELKVSKKELARVLTVIREKQVAEAETVN